MPRSGIAIARTRSTPPAPHGGPAMRPLMLALLAFLALAQPYSAASTQTVSGTIVDAAGAGLPGVSVTIQASDALKRATVTTANGEFRFTGIPVGPATITAALAGFKT